VLSEVCLSAMFISYWPYWKKIGFENPGYPRAGRFEQSADFNILISTAKQHNYKKCSNI